MAGVTYLGPWRSGVTGRPGAAAVTDWYVDPVNGSDANSGLSNSKALKSLAEFQRRLGDQAIDGITVQVHLLADTTANTIRARFMNGGQLYILGQKTVVATDTIAAVTPWNASTGVIGDYTLTNTTTASHVGKFIRVNGGARDGNKAPIAKSTGTKSVRGNFMDQSAWAPVEPQVGDAVQIYTVTKIASNCTVLADGDGLIAFQDVEMGVAGSSHSVVALGGSVEWLACIVHGLDIHRQCDSGTVALSLTYDHRIFGLCEEWGNTCMSVGGAALNPRGGGVATIYARTLVQGYGVSAGHDLQGPGTLVISDPGSGGGPLVIADAAVDGVTCFPGGRVICHDRLFVRDFAAGGLTGYVVKSGGGIYYDAGLVPAAYGTAPATFAKVGGTSKASGAIPYTEATNGASLSVLT
jgi:hypothetical protein